MLVHQRVPAISTDLHGLWMPMISGPTWEKGDATPGIPTARRVAAKRIQRISSWKLSLTDLGRLGVPELQPEPQDVGGCKMLDASWCHVQICANVQSVGDLVHDMSWQITKISCWSNYDLMILLSYCCPGVQLLGRDNAWQCPQVEPFPAIHVGSSVPVSLLAQDESNKGRLAQGPSRWFQCKHPCRLLTLVGRRCSQTSGRHQKYFEGCCTLPWKREPMRTRRLNRDPKRQIRCSATHPQKKWHYRIIIFTCISCIRCIYIYILYIHSIYL